MKNNPFKLIVSLSLPLLAGAVSGYFTVEAIDSWYNLLNKPALNPPNWIFGPVWTTLYLMMGIALYLFWQTKSDNNKKPGFIFFGLQLFTNFLWSLLFFNMHSPLAGMIDIGILIVLIILNICYFYKVNRTAAYLLIPYLAWVMFATYLNVSIFLLN